MDSAPHAALLAYFRQHLPGATETQLAAVEALFEPRQLARHAELTRAGEVARAGAFVVRGCLRAYAVDAKGKEHIL
jgi:CRP-like cAMP-binding protein